MVFSDLFSDDVMKEISSDFIKFRIFSDTFPNPIKPIIIISLDYFLKRSMSCKFTPISHDMVLHFAHNKKKISLSDKSISVNPS